MTFGHIEANVKHKISPIPVDSLYKGAQRGQKYEHPGLRRGVRAVPENSSYYFRESGSEVFFGDFWLR